MVGTSLPQERLSARINYRLGDLARHIVFHAGRIPRGVSLASASEEGETRLALRPTWMLVSLLSKPPLLERRLPGATRRGGRSTRQLSSQLLSSASRHRVRHKPSGKRKINLRTQDTRQGERFFVQRSLSLSLSHPHPGQCHRAQISLALFLPSPPWQG